MCGLHSRGEEVNTLCKAAKHMLEMADVNQYAVAAQAPHSDVMAYNAAVNTLRTALKQEEEASAWLAERKEHWRKEREKAQQVKTCAWRDNLDAIYETECGNLHIVNDGTLEENGMKYCCYCGEEIKDESPT